MAVEMMFHHKFGMNGGPFKITGVQYKGPDCVWYFIFYGGKIIPVNVYITKTDENGKIKRMNIYPL